MSFFRSLWALSDINLAINEVIFTIIILRFSLLTQDYFGPMTHLSIAVHFETSVRHWGEFFDGVLTLVIKSGAHYVTPGLNTDLFRVYFLVSSYHFSADCIQLDREVCRVDTLERWQILGHLNEVLCLVRCVICSDGMILDQLTEFAYDKDFPLLVYDRVL